MFLYYADPFLPIAKVDKIANVFINKFKNTKKNPYSAQEKTSKFLWAKCI